MREDDIGDPVSRKSMAVRLAQIAISLVAAALGIFIGLVAKFACLGDECPMGSWWQFVWQYLKANLSDPIGNPGGFFTRIIWGIVAGVLAWILFDKYLESQPT